MRRAFLAIALLLAAAQALAQDAWRNYPPAPIAGEPFVLQYDGHVGGAGIVTSASVTVSGSTLTWDVVVQTVDFSVAGSYRASTVAPGLAAGNYQVVIRRRLNAVDLAPLTLGTITIASTQGASTPQFHGLTGNWFDPAESGWGVNVIQGDSGKLFAVWLTYLPLLSATLASGPQEGTWLVMPDGLWVSPTQFRGLLYSTTGTAASKPFNPADLGVTPVGYLSLDMTSVSAAAMKAEAAVGLADPVAKQATISRFGF